MKLELNSTSSSLPLSAFLMRNLDCRSAGMWDLLSLCKQVVSNRGGWPTNFHNCLKILGSAWSFSKGIVNFERKVARCARKVAIFNQASISLPEVFRVSMRQQSRAERPFSSTAPAEIPAFNKKRTSLKFHVQLLIFIGLIYFIETLFGTVKGVFLNTKLNICFTRQNIILEKRAQICFVS